MESKKVKRGQLNVSSNINVVCNLEDKISDEQLYEDVKG